MSTIALLVFREMLEIVVVGALVLAATRGVAGRWAWTLLGVACGIAGAAIVAVFAEHITESLAGVGQEIFSAVVLAITAIMVAATVYVMRISGRRIVGAARETAHRIVAGTAPRWLLATTIGFSILRDGSELVVFIIGARAGGQVTTGDLVLGFAIGIVIGLLVGALMYYGIIRASVRHIFTVVTVLLAFLAAGLMAQAAGFLSSAGFLPPLVDELWDTEDVLSQRIGIGQFLHALLGYMSQPSGIQLAVYVVTLLAVGWLGLRRLPAPAAAAR
jgi:high-affinity iron transporter